MRDVRHPEEHRRLQALREYGVLDSTDAVRLDALVALVAQLCEVPVAFVNVLEEDRQIYLAEVGWGATEAPRDPGVCNHAILQNEIFEIPDARLDPRFAQIPILTGENGLRFYAGAPLRTPEGLPLGTLCVMDRHPRSLTPLQRVALQGLADQIMALLDLHLEVRRLERGSAIARTISPADQAEAEFLRVVTDRLPVRVGYLDRSYRYEFLNGAYERMFGFAPREAWGRHVEAIVGTSAWLTAKPFIDRALAGEANVQEFTARYPFGEVRVEGGFVPDFAPDGTVRGIVIYGLDVTERYEAQQALVAERESLQQILETAEVATWRLDLVHDRVFSSRRTEFLFGVPEGEGQSAPLSKYIAAIHEDDRARVTGAIGRSIEAAERYEIDYRVLGLDGQERWVLARGSTERGEDGKAHALTGVLIDVTARHRADETIRESEERYQTLFESIDEGFCVLENIEDDAGNVVDHRYLEINPAFERLTGLSAEVTLSGQTIRQIVPGYEEFWIQTYGRVAQTGIPVRATNEVKALNRWFEVNAARVGGEGSRRVAVVFNEITARKVAELERETLLAELGAEREKLRTIFQQAPAFLALLHGRDFIFEYANAAYMDLVGERALIGKSVREAVPEAAAQGFVDILTRVLDTGERFVGNEVPIMLVRNPGEPPSRRYLDFVYQPVRQADGSVESIIALGIDVTEAVEARLRVAQSEEQFRTVFENAPDAIVVMDLDRNVRAWNPAAAVITGWTAQEAIGAQADLIFTPEDRANAVPAHEAETARREGKAADERWHLRKDGVRFWASGAMNALYDADGRVRGYLKVFRDATERYEMERRIRSINEELETKVVERTQELQDAVREAEGFNYSIAHDLRTPLRAIVATARILDEELGPTLDEAYRDMLERQAYNAIRLGRLIDELLRLSRLSRVPVNREAVDLTREAVSVAEELDPARRIEAQEGMAAQADRALLRTVLQNLIGNAFKFSPPATTVWVGHADGAYFVRDEGVGFDVQFAAKVFLPFERLVREDEFEGTGIGLANVERIVKRHGGRVWVDSAPGEGSTFYFTLG